MTVSFFRWLSWWSESWISSLLPHNCPGHTWTMPAPCSLCSMPKFKIAAVWTICPACVSQELSACCSLRLPVHSGESPTPVEQPTLPCPFWALVLPQTAFSLVPVSSSTGMICHHASLIVHLSWLCHRCKEHPWSSSPGHRLPLQGIWEYLFSAVCSFLINWK